MSIMNYFQASSSDQSIAYLGQLFGGLGQLPGTPGILASMFQVFNSIILVVGLFLVIYVVVLGIVTTAHEGEFLGKKFHGLWTPVRMVIGIASLIPTASGYSSLQIIIMWFILQGIGVADTLWTNVVTYVQTYGSIYAQGSTLAVGVSPTLQQLFAGLTCTATTSLSNNDLSTYATHRWSVGPSPFTYGYYSTNGNAPQATLVCNVGSNCTLTFPSQCGILQFASTEANSSAVSPAVVAQQTVLIGANYAESTASLFSVNTITLQPNVNAISILDKLYLLAYSFALSDQQYVNFYSDSPMNPTNAQDETAKSSSTNPDYMGSIIDTKPSEWGWISNNYCNKSKMTISPCCVSTSQSAASPSGCPVPTGGQAVNDTNFPNPDSDIKSPTDASDAAATLYLNYNVKQIAMAYPNLWLRSGAPPSPTAQAMYTEDQLNSKTGGDFLNAILSNLSVLYIEAIQAAIGPPPNTNGIDLNASTTNGWIFAGAFYYQLTTGSNNALQQANPLIKYQPSSGSAPPDSRMNTNAAIKLFGSGSTMSSAAMPNYASTIATGTESVLNGFMNSISNTSGNFVNPLIKLQSFGQQLLLSVEILYPILLTLEMFSAVVTTISTTQVLGTGTTLGTWPIFFAVMAFVGPVTLATFAIMISIGGLLAVYTPLIPFIIFTMGAVGWFISVIETMVAAPLLAIGILSPSAQHHEILGKAEGALMTVFSLILKPSLMIFGLIAGLLLASIAVMLINATFATAMSEIVAGQVDAAGNSATAQHYVDLLELIFFMSAYLFLVLSALNKCFSMIVVLPGKVMSFIGGQAEGGETEALGEVKGAVGTAAGKTSGAGAFGTKAGVGKAYRKEAGRDDTGGQKDEAGMTSKGEGSGDDKKEDGEKDKKGKGLGGLMGKSPNLRGSKK